MSQTKQQTGSAGIKLIRVIPFSRGMGKETLSYFSAKDIAPGTIVSVPVRRRTIDALVVGAEDVTHSKTELKEVTYKLKKVLEVRGASFFLPEFIRAAERAAAYFAASTGAVLDALAPRAILATLPSGAPPAADIGAKKKEEKAPRDKPVTHEKFIFQTPENERLGAYKSLIREEFARGHSVFFCFPTVHDLERIEKDLSRGIEEYAFTLHGDLSKREQLAVWNKALEETHPVLVVATGMFLSLPRRDIRTIVLERESSGAYKRETRPFLDIRTVSEMLAEELGCRLIFGDIFLRTETLYRHDRKELLELAPPKFRVLTSAEQQLIDMKEAKRREKDRERFTLISEEVKELLFLAKQANERVFLFTYRRGLYPLTVCGDCGTAVPCPRCKTPYVLHKSPMEKSPSRSRNIFVCHKCGMTQESKDKCHICASWRLKTLGIGSERVEDEVGKLFPSASIIRIDKDATRTKKQTREASIRFYETPGSILVGTEMSLPYLQHVPNVAVLSIDSLFTIPNFRINERIFNLLLRVRSKASMRFLIQTRLADSPVFNTLLQGNLIDFHRTEIAERKEFRYPPLTTLIKLSATGTKRAVHTEMARVKKALADYDPAVFPAFTPKVKQKYTMNALVRVPRGAWPDKTLADALRLLSPAIAIDVDPETIL